MKVLQTVNKTKRHNKTHQIIAHSDVRTPTSKSLRDKLLTNLAYSSASEHILQLALQWVEDLAMYKLEH